ncbi:tripartite tricarboxylate transporter substrate binding protein [Devosia sp. BSSL-BM10]|uniref:Tripartite tricarboxylate transporter substrate binding protein n=1 Tax=Devosia litorisediminis TaxID=2829817 RepID=A0A942E6B8_9HYPH|nr:tripartite tricarboxylate transporter substrate binding protein [Devosia litorisediminis]MBS3848825.1 tripartite tricarboxylate transporter substrate binding protein [Devosia litorisediminis]
MFKKLVMAAPILAMMAGTAFAQDDYPSRSIRFIIGFGAGGNADTVARIIGEDMSKTLGQPVVVESKPGAGGNVASDFVSKAEPDGYTIQLMVGGHAVSAALYNEQPFDPIEDFTFVSTIGQFPFFVAARAGAFDSIEDLIAQAKAAPGTLKIGHSGVGSTQHLTGELMDMETGADFIHIPYKGGAAAATALLGGEVDVVIDTGTVVAPQAEGGEFDLLAVSSKDPWPTMSDVPSLSNTVAPGLDIVSWTGVGMPAGVDPAIVEKVRSAVHAALANPEVADRIVALGAFPKPNSGEEMRGMIEHQIAVWTAVVDAAGIEKN